MYNMLQNEVEMVTEDVQSQKKIYFLKKVFKNLSTTFWRKEAKQKDFADAKWLIPL